MRITLQSYTGKLRTTLTDLTARQAQQQARIATGERLLRLSDAPTDIPNIVSYRSNIAKLERYSSTLDSALAENATVESALVTIGQTMTDTHTLGIDVLQIANHDKWAVIAQQVLTKIRTLIEAANTSHGDVFVLSGTKNTAASLTPSPPEQMSVPFELVATTPSPSNPSGLEVRFKGNIEPRYVQTGDGNTEQVATTADAVFGTGGTEVFDTLITLYNTLAFHPDGTPRSEGQLPTAEQLDAVAALVKRIADASGRIQSTTSALGIRTERMAAQREQIDQDLTRQREFLSRLADTDVAAATMQLQRDQIAYEYSLRIGARIMNLSLFDFLR
ncbi:MAG: flagellin [Chlorobi bacterium]|nr:flagellin [Chlorobiota bacterium]